jgi:hypothetical protein
MSLNQRLDLAEATMAKIKTESFEGLGIHDRFELEAVLRSATIVELRALADGVDGWINVWTAVFERATHVACSR